MENKENHSLVHSSIVLVMYLFLCSLFIFHMKDMHWTSKRKDILCFEARDQSFVNIALAEI